MKKLTVLLCAIAFIVTASSCHGNHTSITYNESDHYYSMNAYFKRSKTREVERYLDRMLRGQADMSFIDSRINGTIALEDHTIFYIKKYPGILTIKFNKDENSYEAYENIRDMCEGIKEVVSR